MRKVIFGSLITLVLVAAIVTAQATGITLLPGSNTLKSLHIQGYPGLGIYSPAAGYMMIGDTSQTGIICIDGSGCSASFGITSVVTSTQTGSVQGSTTAKSLTDAALATAAVTIAVPTNGHVAGTLGWMAKSLSGADQLVATGDQRWWATDTAGTPVCGINKVGTDGEGHSGGGNTLVCTWTNVVATTNCVLSVTCTNDLAATQAISLYRNVYTQIPATVTFN